MASTARHHADWLRLVETSGPFLSLPVLVRAFPQGLEAHDPDARARLAEAYEQWLAREDRKARGDLRAIHHGWILHVLRETLGFPAELLLQDQALPTGLNVQVREHCEVLSPSFALVSPKGRPDAGKPRLLVRWYDARQDLERALPDSRWVASPVSRMVELLHATDVRLGLVTNGEHWMLVHAPRGETTGTASFWAHLFLEERVTLQAFRSLLGVERFFNQPDSDTLEGLFAESARDQQEVTDQLGLQVRRAVELLVAALDRADRERRRTLLAGVSDREAYEAALAVMMRLVFLFCAEERDLLLLGDPFYDAHYAVSTLGPQLREAEDRVGKQVLERRHDAWSRLLATFRAVHGGVQHESMRLPAYGGSLFDPDRFPFLEGRARGTSWRDQAADPLPIDNHTVLQLLEALQFLQVSVKGGTERRRLSFRALDVEQIGHIYEGLLDHTAIRARGPVLGLKGGGGYEPEVPLARLEELRGQGPERFVEAMVEETRRNDKAVRKCVEYALDEPEALLRACEHDEALYERIRPFAGFVREDEPEHPVVILDGSLYVTQGSDRRTTGTHYTPRSLTEEVVRYTLEPQVYEGPAEGLPKEQWRLKAARELLSLKVCDFAMGSGAFLVQSCRYLSERLVEAWEEAERAADGRLVITPEGDLGTGAPSERAIPKDLDERLAIGRRVVADRCLFGVDKNPMAVEMAKLSLWLITLQKDRPFTFLDHALRAGDSLLGITELAQVEQFDLSGGHAAETKIAARCKQAVKAALEKRRALESFSVETAADAERKLHLLEDAERALADVRLIADLLVGLELQEKGEQLEQSLDNTKKYLAHALTGEDWAGPNREKYLEQLRHRAGKYLGERRPFHWPLEFPEAFLRPNAPGFDAIVGNPPFAFGTIASGTLSEGYTRYLRKHGAPPWHGKADLVVAFYKRAPSILAERGVFSLLATSAVLRGETWESGLRPLTEMGWVIFRGKSPFLWPGTANVEVVISSLTRHWRGEHRLDGRVVNSISSRLTAVTRAPQEPFPLIAGIPAFLGVKLSPGNAEIDPAARARLLDSMPDIGEILLPVLGGEELYSLRTVDKLPWAVDPDRLNALPSERQDLYCMALKRSPPALKHSRPAAALLDALGRSERAFACGETSVHLSFLDVPLTGRLLKHKLIVFPNSDWTVFALLQSSIHVAWAWALGLRRMERIVYSPKRCAATFPLPTDPVPPGLADAARAFYESRAEHCRRDQCSATEFYNRFHSSSIDSRELGTLRSMQRDLDSMVLRWYGITGAEETQFCEGERGERFQLPEATTADILARLMQLNHERYAEEVRQGLHEKGAKKGRSAEKDAPRSTTPARRTKDMFNPAATRAKPGGSRQAGVESLPLFKAKAASAAGSLAANPAEDAVLGSLRKAGEALSKAQVLERAGVGEAEGAAALKALVEAKRVVVEGKGRGTRYRLGAG